MKESKTTIMMDDIEIHVVFGKTVEEWEAVFGDDESLWDFDIKELFDGAVEPNPEIWYWYIGGRFYETNIEA